MSGIRVIAGSARGRRLQLVPGDSTRPITDRVKENLFNIIGVDVAGASFLDAFAGTGSVGIEALSRGADFARFLDLNRRAIRTIRSNLEHTGFTGKSEVLQRDAFVRLESRPDRAFDYIYLAPPQYRGMWSRALALLDANTGWLTPDGWAIVQIDPKEYEPVPLERLTLFDERKYGRTKLLFLRLQDG